MNVVWITTDEDLIRCVHLLRRSKVLYYDFETTGLDPHTHRVLLLSLYTQGDTVYVIDFTKGIDPLPLRALFAGESSTKVAHNAVFDAKWIKKLFDFYPKPSYCTLIAEQEICSGVLERGMLRLDAMAEKYTGTYLTKSTRDEFIDADEYWQPTQEHIDYAALDAFVLKGIHEAQLEQITRLKLERVNRLDMRQIPIAAHMEWRGVRYSLERSSALAEATKPLLVRAHQAIQELFINAGVVDTIMITDADGIVALNPSSVPQMLKALHAVGVDIEGTGEKDIIEWDAKNNGGMTVEEAYGTLSDEEAAGTLLDFTGVANPFLRARLLYTQLNKLYNTYAVGFDKLYNPVTESVHFGMKPCGAAATGRYSSSPNGQNMPKNAKLKRFGLGDHSFRGCFEARPGKRFIIADLSGIELAILAAYSGDKKLASILPPNDDPHAWIAAELFGVTRTHKDLAPFSYFRDAAKTTNYAIPYGTTKYNLSRTISRMLSPVGFPVGIDKAQWVIDSWNALFPDAGVFLRGNAQKAITDFYTESIMGRKRFWPESVRFNKWEGFAAMREGQNHPIQASCADMLKLGMEMIDDYFAPFNRGKVRAELLLCVHDEVICEVDEDIADQLQLDVVHLMHEAGEVLFPGFGHCIVAEGHVSERYDK